MTPLYEVLFLLCCHLVLLLVVARDGNGHGGGGGECPDSFECGYIGSIRFPFTTTERPDCGLFPIQNCYNDPNMLRMIQFQNKGKRFVVILEPIVSPAKTSVHIRDIDFYDLLQSNPCEAFRNSYKFAPTFHFVSLSVEYNTTLFRCNRSHHVSAPMDMHNYTRCHGYDLYYNPFVSDGDHSSLAACTKVLLPIKDVPDAKDPSTFVTADISVQVHLSEECVNCHYKKRGQCRLDSKSKFYCANADEKKGLSWRLKLGLGLGIGILGILLICLVFLFLLYKRRHASSGGDFQSKNSFYESSLNPHLESGGAYFGVPLFHHKELKEATNNFDHTKELGDGGFGTVYYGKLQDGREVAVKRLYEHNYRRVEQFINEIQILTRLRHKNLVSLYGCTSRHSRELLLVYEYIPNGTVASHIHGELAKPGLPPWSTRIKIALETATALAYLHACDIIHRDVKTNNILLDSNFTVKVADFGLSRLFPIDATHVSTAPQGTPGYVDPEYYQNYQLTSKSDVYSFGVVLVELISSKPAVDINRDKEEINLSNLAIKRIQESAISDLVDHSLGFDSDNEVKRMIVSVAELAFQCLQRDKELRPSMDEVLDELKKIESGNIELELQEELDVNGSAGASHSNSVRPPPPPSPDQWDGVGLLKNKKFPTSPNTVTDKWESKSTTPNASA